VRAGRAAAHGRRGPVLREGKLSPTVARTLTRIRSLPLLVAVVLALCGVAIAAAFLVPPHGTEPSVPIDVPPRQPVAVAPPPPPPQLRPSPPPVPAAPAVALAPVPSRSESIDWKSLPVQPQGVLLGELAPIGQLAVRRAMPRLRRCLPPPPPAGTPPQTLDVALGLTGEEGSYTIQHVEVLGSTATDRAVETCVTQSLIGLRFAVRGSQDWKQLRISSKIAVPSVLGGRQRNE